MPTIRQEINILDAVPSTSFASEVIQLDTTQYSGSATYYFETIAKVSAGTLTLALVRQGGTTETSISVTETSYTRKRVSFTPPAGQTEYHVTLSAGTSPSLKAARIIVIDSPTILTSTETQIEIGMNKTGLTSTATAPRVVPDSTLTKYWKYTAASWDGTTTFYAEVTYAMASSKSSGTFVLQEDNGSFASWTDKVTIVNAGIATSTLPATRVRSASFTPTDGRHYRIAYSVASSKSTASIFNAKIIVDQTPTSLYYINASTVAATDPGAVWTNDANEFDGSISTFATATTVGSTSSNYLYGGGSNAPASGATINTVMARLYWQMQTAGGGSLTINSAIYTASLGELLGTITDSDNSTAHYSDFITLSTPSGGWTWAKIQALEAKTYISARVGVTAAVAKIDILVNPDPTLLEPQYLLLNTADSNATGVQSYQTLWDSTEWSGVTNVYTHAMDSDNASNSAELRDLTAGADITSTVTGANQQISSAITMPTTGHEIDTWILNTTGVVGADRIIVASTVSSSVSATITQVAGTVTATGGTQAVSAVAMASAAVTQVAATVTASGGTQIASTALNVAVTQVAATVTASGGTQTVATTQLVSIAQVAATVTASGGTQTIATVNKVAIAQVAGSVTASGGTQVIATSNFVAISQLAGSVTASGGTQAIATTQSSSITQVAATVTATGGTQLAQTKASIAQVAATVTVSGGTQAIATVNIVAITQVAATVTASGGTQVVATTRLVAISQVAGTVTASGGTQAIATVNNVAITQVAGSVTASGGTQVITTSNFVAVAQVAATVTASGGTQVVASTRVVSISQLAGTVTASGGTQVIATVNNVAISQIAGSVTAAGGTQVLAAGLSINITQVAATVTASGGTQAIVSLSNVSITQVAATVTASGGTQAALSAQVVSVTQVAATVTASGGTQIALASLSATIAQVAATVTASGGTQSIASLEIKSLIKIVSLNLQRPSNLSLALGAPGPLSLSLRPVELPLSVAVPEPLPMSFSLSNPALSVSSEVIDLSLVVPEPIAFTVSGN